MLIKIKALTNCKKERLVKKDVDSFEIRIKQRPINNQANLKIIKILANYFNLPENKIKLIRGHKYKNKIFEILRN